MQANFKNVRLNLSAPASVNYYFEDELGTSRIITDASGNPCYDADFYPFGAEQYVYLNNCPQNYKFTGKERDAETGLDEFGARYYSSALGRFTIPDWAAKPTAVPYAKFGDPQSLNLYSYVENAPVNRADRDGHEVVLDNKQKSDRVETEHRLIGNTTQAEQKLFKAVTDPKTGTTKLTLTSAAKSFKGPHTVAFTRLADAIGQKHVATVGIHDTFVGSDGQSHPTPVGGVTVGRGQGVASDATVTLNRNGMGHGEMSVIPGTNVPAPTEIIAAHEVMGHALENLKGGDPSESHVREIENQMRKEEGLPPRGPE